MELDLFPWIGARPIREITAPELLTCLRRIEERGALDTAHRAHQNCGQVFRYAVATGRAERDPSADLRGALPPVKSGHFANITEPEKVAALLRSIDSYDGSPITRVALRLAPLVFVRPGELRHAEWAEINFLTAEWRIAAEKMKARVLHIVPLSRQSLALFTELRPLTEKWSRYVFPAAVTQHAADVGEHDQLRTAPNGPHVIGHDGSRLPEYGEHVAQRTGLASGRDRTPARAR